MTTALDHVNGSVQDIDPVAVARAEAIRRQAETEAEERLIAAQAAADAERIRAEGDAEAARILAVEEAAKQRLINERTAQRLAREKAETDAKIAEANQKREAAERARLKAQKEAEAEERQQVAEAQKKEGATRRWRTFALAFAIVCGIVSLPLQMMAFYSPQAWFLVAAPLVLEGGAWVMLQGAAAAIEEDRPTWHYRLAAGLVALFAAYINWDHGHEMFGMATGIAGAFCSIAGPAVWDFHEHGRIAKKAGKLTRRERKEQEKKAKGQAAKDAAEAKKKEAEEKAKSEAEKARAEQLAKTRAEEFEDVWKHALKLAAALGETTVTDKVWDRAHRDVRGAAPGEDADTLRLRNAAERRVLAARSEAPGEKPVRAANAQRASQMPPAPKTRTYNPPTRRGVRTKGDTAKFPKAARAVMSDTAKKAAQKAGEEQ